jgi:hypothetical protein
VDDSIIGSAKHELGEGGVENIMDWLGVISTYICSVILISLYFILLEYRSC